MEYFFDISSRLKITRLEKKRIKSCTVSIRVYANRFEKSNRLRSGNFPGVHSAKITACISHTQSTKCIKRAVIERHWRNKRTGADDWPTTRWPRYLRWYWLAIKYLYSHNQTCRHLTLLPLHPSFSAHRPFLVCPLMSVLFDLVSLVLTQLRPLSLRSTTCLPPDVPFRFPARQNWIYGFIFLLCGQRLSANCSPKALLRITTK